MNQIKNDKKEKILYSCKSETTQEEYAKLSDYFLRFYLIAIIYGTVLNIITTIIICLFVNEKLLVGLILFTLIEIIILVVYKIRLKKIVKSWFSKLQKKNPVDTESFNEFYEDYMIKKSKNKRMRINYENIIKVIETNTNFYLKDSKFIVILQKEKCSENLIIFIKKKFKNNLVDKSSKQKQRNKKEYNEKNVKRGMIALFILSLLSMFGALYTNILVSKDNILKNMWVFWLWLPIPVASIVLGFIFIKKNIKCIKNIVAGFIVSFLLLIYGCFSFINFDIYNVNNSKNNVINIINENKNFILDSIKNDDIKSLNKVKGVKKIYVNRENGYIDFYCSGYGLVPSGIYVGFYYSYDGSPKHINSNIDLVFDGKGYYYKQRDGDNTYYTEKIVDNIYYYEAHF